MWHLSQGEHTTKVIAEGKTSVFDLSSSSLLKDALKAKISMLNLIPEAVFALLSRVN